MSDEQFDEFTPDGDAPRPAKKKGMSTGAKVAIVLGIAGGVCLLVCCGVVGFFVNKVQKSITVDPAAVAKIRESILTSINLPADFNPKMGMDLTIAGQGMKMAVFGRGAGPEPQDGAMLMLMQFPAGADPQQMQQQMERNMGKQTQIKVESTESKLVQIDGSEVKFEFVKGKTQDGGQDVRQVTGVFPGKQGMVMLMLLLPDADFDEAAVTSMLESIQK
jgi:F0F1-type ATP synthase membrane subunit c/vacuolar-type H+-ATPase subunit K